MQRRKRHLRLKSIIFTNNNKIVKFDYSRDEKYIGSSEEKKMKYDLLEKINDDQKSNINQIQEVQNKDLTKKDTYVMVFGDLLSLEKFQYFIDDSDYLDEFNESSDCS